MASNELVTMDIAQLPSTQVGSDDQFKELAKGTDFLGRLDLFTKGKLVNKGLVRPGNYGIPEGEGVEDLGPSVDIVPLARRPKALDMSDTDAIIAVYDPENEEFQRIAAASAEADSHCMYGPSFLVFERSTGRFLELFCGTKSKRAEANKIYPYLPLTEKDIAARKLGDQKPHGPIPLTLGSRLIEKSTFSWHVPVVSKCSTPISNFPTMDKVVKEITAFLTFKGDGVEKVAEAAGKPARKR